MFSVVDINAILNQVGISKYILTGTKQEYEIDRNKNKKNNESYATNEKRI